MRVRPGETVCLSHPECGLCFTRRLRRLPGAWLAHAPAPPPWHAADARRYIDPEQAQAGRDQAGRDWSAGAVRANQDVARRMHSSYALAYIARIGELQAGHSWRRDG